MEKISSEFIHREMSSVFAALGNICLTFATLEIRVFFPTKMHCLLSKGRNDCTNFHCQYLPQIQNVATYCLETDIKGRCELKVKQSKKEETQPNHGKGD